MVLIGFGSLMVRSSLANAVFAIFSSLAVSCVLYSLFALLGRFWLIVAFSSIMPFASSLLLVSARYARDELGVNPKMQLSGFPRGVRSPLLVLTILALLLGVEEFLRIALTQSISGGPYLTLQFTYLSQLGGLILCTSASIIALLKRGAFRFTTMVRTLLPLMVLGLVALLLTDGKSNSICVIVLGASYWCLYGLAWITASTLAQKIGNCAIWLFAYVEMCICVANIVALLSGPGFVAKSGSTIPTVAVSIFVVVVGAMLLLSDWGLRSLGDPGFHQSPVAPDEITNQTVSEECQMVTPKSEAARMTTRKAPPHTLSQAVPSQGMASGRLLLWIVVLSIAFGIGESITNMGYSTAYSKLGMALPELTVLLGLWLLPRRFDIGIFSKATLALVLVGLVGAFFSHASMWAPQVTLSASNESLQMFALMIACFVAHQRHCSSAYYCALIMGCMTLPIRLGLILGQALAPSANWFYVAVLVLVALSGIALLREDKFDRQLHLDYVADTDNNERLVQLSLEHGLSKREQSVFLLLAQGSGYDEISESLFIAPSTVRAHASRIYEKFGTHTRKEFEDALMQESTQGKHSLIL